MNIPIKLGFHWTSGFGGDLGTQSTVWTTMTIDDDGVRQMMTIT